LRSVSLKPEFGIEERGAELGDQLLGGIGLRAETAAKIPVKAMLGARPMRQFVERVAVERGAERNAANAGMLMKSFDGT
jgi:hypothetical protein